MEFRLLGPVEADVGGQRLDLGPRRQRFILAVLALEANQPVPLDRLVDLSWPGSPPRTATNAVMVCVSKLRLALSIARDEVELARQGSGYVLRTDPMRVDAHRFRALTEQARRAAADAQRIDLLEQGLRLWSGPALDGAAPAETRDRLCRGLDEARLAALEDRLDARLRLGRHRESLDELSGLVDAYPLRERMVAQLMLALYRSGRAGEALTAYRAMRDRLATELGLDPGTELQRLERAVLRDDPAIAAPSPSIVVKDEVTVPAQLPPTVSGFAGRGAQLGWLDALVADASAPGAAVVVAVIAGTAGVGKTALAVHWAHRARGRFPDGQLYVNLRGYEPGGYTRPLGALAHFLRALGVPAEQVPADRDAATAMYRTILTDRRVLVVLDNAAGPDQVRPLLPGSPGCLVLVTSRDRLGGLVARDGARRLTLDVLTPDDAHTLLVSVLGSGRVAAEPAAAGSLARLCAHLPLALRIAAANLTDDPRRSIGGYVAELARGNRLAALAVEGDEQAAVRVAFDRSQVSLPPATRRLFRLLGLAPGPDVDESAAAALAGTTRDEAVTALDRLTAAHLIDQRSPGRFAFHDLLRLYARELTAADDTAAERDAAIGRLLSFYLGGVDAAARQLYPHMQRLAQPALDEPGPTFRDNASAVAWLEAERANLVSAIQYAATSGPKPMAWLLADGLRGYFWLRRHAVEWLAVAGAGLAAATDEGDLYGRAAAHLSLGQAMRWMARHDEAVTHYDRARELSRRAGWESGEGAALGSLANVYRDQGRLTQAADHYRQVVEVYRRTGARAGQAVTYSNLGHVYLELGRLREALDQYREGLKVSTEIGSRIGQAVALDGFGTVCHQLGRLDEALEHLGRALAIHRETGSREGEADALTVLGEVHRSAGRYPQALTHAGEALVLAREAAVPRVEVDALNSLGSIHRQLGAHDVGAGHHGDARRLASDTGYRFGETAALVGLAAADLDAGQLDEALAHGHRALGLARRAGFRVLEGQALTALADIYLARGCPEEASAHVDAALEAQRETGHRPVMS